MRAGSNSQGDPDGMWARFWSQVPDARLRVPSTLPSTVVACRSLANSWVMHFHITEKYMNLIRVTVFESSKFPFLSLPEKRWNWQLAEKEQSDVKENRATAICLLLAWTCTTIAGKQSCWVECTHGSKYSLSCREESSFDVFSVKSILQVNFGRYYSLYL